MPILGRIFVYMVIWWVVLFVVLPWGVKREENPEAGHDPGAPVNPHLKAKLIATSLVALAIWGLAFFIVDHYDLSLAIFERSKP
jgi:predicted secreted protein